MVSPLRSVKATKAGFYVCVVAMRPIWYRGAQGAHNADELAHAVLPGVVSELDLDTKVS